MFFWLNCNVLVYYEHIIMSLILKSPRMKIRVVPRNEIQVTKFVSFPESGPLEIGGNSLLYLHEKVTI